MEEQMKELLIKSKDDSTCMEKVVEIFSPLLKSYGRRAGWKIESEDMESLLTIRLIEIVRTMKVYDINGQNVNYIKNGIKYHYVNIVSRINKIQGEDFCDLCDYDNVGEEDETDTVFDHPIEGLDEKKKEILILKFKGMYTDQEIAETLHITRQAVNKQLRKAYKQLLPFAK